EVHHSRIDLEHAVVEQDARDQHSPGHEAEDDLAVEQRAGRAQQAADVGVDRRRVDGEQPHEREAERGTETDEVEVTDDRATTQRERATDSRLHQSALVPASKLPSGMPNHPSITRRTIGAAICAPVPASSINATTTIFGSSAGANDANHEN